MGRLSIKHFILRLVAASIDMFMGAALGFLLSFSRIGYFFASRAVVMLKIGSPETIWKGPIPMIMGILGPFVYVLPLSILLVLMIEPLTGASLGKRILRLKIISANDEVVPKRKLWYRSAIKASCFWGLVAALLFGNWVLALCSIVIGCMVSCSMVLSLFSSLAPLHEVRSQTSVVKIIH
jgi:hypothetical protein